MRGPRPRPRWENRSHGRGDRREDGPPSCRLVPINKEGDWESVLLITSPTPGRFLVTRNDMRERPRQLHGRQPTVNDCQDPLAWIPTTTLDWVKAHE